MHYCTSNAVLYGCLLDFPTFPRLLNFSPERSLCDLFFAGRCIRKTAATPGRAWPATGQTSRIPGRRPGSLGGPQRGSRATSPPTGFWRKARGKRFGTPRPIFVGPSPYRAETGTHSLCLPRAPLLGSQAEWIKATNLIGFALGGALGTLGTHESSKPRLNGHQSTLNEAGEACPKATLQPAQNFTTPNPPQVSQSQSNPKPLNQPKIQPKPTLTNTI